MKIGLPAFLLFSAVSAFSQVGATYTDHYLATLVVPIQDWNMVADENHYIDINDNSIPAKPADFDPVNIVSVEAVVHDDAFANTYNFSGHRVGTFLWGGWYSLTCFQTSKNCQVVMDRGLTISSRYANSDFDAYGNRGYVLIRYHSPSGAGLAKNVHTHWEATGGMNMVYCLDASSCMATNINGISGVGSIAAMNGFILSDNEPTTTISNFENLVSGGDPNTSQTKGTGGLLKSSGRTTNFIMPYKLGTGGGAFLSRFKTTKYDGGSNRGYLRLTTLDTYSPTARQPFIVKSRYKQIGPWCFSGSNCSGSAPWQKQFSITNLTSSPQRIVGVDAGIHSDVFGGDVFSVTNIRRGNERSELNGNGTSGGKIHGEVVVEAGSTTGTLTMEVDGRTDPEKYWMREGHTSSPQRGWVKIDYLAAKCGEGGNGTFGSSANIGFSTPPSNDCNGYAVVDNIATHVLMSQASDIYGTADQFRYVYSNGSSGNFAIAAKIDHVENRNYWNLGCIMLRSNTSASSANVGICHIGNGQATFQYRLPSSSSPNSTTQNTIPGYDDYRWVKLVKSGNTVSGYVAKGDDYANPQTMGGWQFIGSVNGVIGSSYTYGLAATSYSSGNWATAGILGAKTWTF